MTNSIAEEQDKAAFFEVVDQFVQTSDHAEQKRLKLELARVTFGEASAEELAPADATP